MGHTLTEAGSMLQSVLTAMDEEMTTLQTRLDRDAAELRQVVDALTSITAEDRSTLLKITSAIERTAHRVATFAHRPEDDEDQAGLTPQPTQQSSKT